jgi:hypothetical protein
MKTEPLFDRDEINEIIHIAKLNRAEFFRHQSESIKRPTRWWSFANGLTLFRQRRHFLRFGLGARLTSRQSRSGLDRHDRRSITPKFCDFPNCMPESLTWTFLESAAH